jgi:hypothetical protein
MKNFVHQMKFTSRSGFTRVVKLDAADFLLAQQPADRRARS